MANVLLYSRNVLWVNFNEGEKSMKKISIVVAIILCLSLSTMAFAKSEVSILWALYDGLTTEYAQALTEAFEKAHPDIDLNIIETPWNQMHDKLITSLAADQAPDLG